MSQQLQHRSPKLRPLSRATDAQPAPLRMNYRTPLQLLRAHSYHFRALKPLC